MQKLILIVVALCAATGALDSGDNKFMKDYAMLKIYESCFGTELLKQITKELKEACAKCSAAPPVRETMNSQMPPILFGKLPPGFAMDPNTQTITKPGDGAFNNNQENDLPNQDAPQQSHKSSMSGVFAFRPNGAPFSPVSPVILPGGPQLRPYSMFPFQYQAFPAPGSGYQVPYNPYYPQYQTSPYYQQPFFGSNRMSRQLSLRNRLGLSSPRIQSHNVTCVMQELGYIDNNLEPNFEHITQRIDNLPVGEELRADIKEGLHFCQKFSECIPEDKRDMVSRPQEQIKAIFFFRCYKHKKLEACIMKDISEHYNKDYPIDTETDFGTFSRSGRSTRSARYRDPSMEALEEMGVYLYDYLSGGGAFDFDLYI